MYKYEDIIRKKLIEFKFDGKAHLYKTFGEMIYTKQLINFIKNFDIIIPVPISRKRMKERGYNQSELVIKYVIKKLKQENIKVNINLEKQCLYKIKNIKAQSTMKTAKERQNNIKGAYVVKNKNKILGKNIIIFDDIFTTGSTANECAKALKYSGARKIGIITIAKD